MNAIAADARGRFVAAAAWQPEAAQRHAAGASVAADDRAPAGPSVAVLCARQRGPAVASAVALALAQACGRPCALAAAVGGSVVPALSLTPASMRAAAQLRRDGLDARARGRLVWLADRRGDLAAARSHDGEQPGDAPLDSTAATAHDGEQPGYAPLDSTAATAHDGEQPGDAPLDLATATAHDGGRPGDAPLDSAAATAALSVELRRAAGVVTAPSALAIPFSRCDALDRVLAWHDAIVFVREPGATVVIADLVLASLRGLGCPVVALEAPRRLAAAAAGAGLRAPAPVIAAVAELGFAGANG